MITFFRILLVFVGTLFFCLFFQKTADPTAPAPPELEVVTSETGDQEYQLYITDTSYSVDIRCYPGMLRKIDREGETYLLSCANSVTFKRDQSSVEPEW